MDKTYEQEVLEAFLNKPIDSSKEVLEEFAMLNNAFYFSYPDAQSFVYVPGDRKDRVLLIAHADTVWHMEFTKTSICNPKLIFENGLYKGDSEQYGIGADDRAGCALLYLLKDSGHSLLITDGEEMGLRASNYIRLFFNDLYDELNCHNYMLQFDLGGNCNYKYYDTNVTDTFAAFIEENTGFKLSDKKKGQTDIATLASDICGANLSIGYYNQHTCKEQLSYSSWLNILSVVRKMLEGEHRVFPTLLSDLDFDNMSK